jgi:hypothetical protein
MSKSRHASTPLQGNRVTDRKRRKRGWAERRAPSVRGPYMEAFPLRQWLFSRISAESAASAANRGSCLVRRDRSGRVDFRPPAEPFAPRDFRRTDPLPKQRTVRTRQAAMPPTGPSFLDFQRGPEASSRFDQDRRPNSPFKSCSEFFGAFSEGWPAEARRPVGVSAISFTAPDSSIPIRCKKSRRFDFPP